MTVVTGRPAGTANGHRRRCEWLGQAKSFARDLQRLEAGDPGVGIGIVATALWLIQRDGELGMLAAPEHDRGAIEMDVREAVALGRARAQAAATSPVEHGTPKGLRCACMS